MAESKNRRIVLFDLNEDTTLRSVVDALEGFGKLIAIRVAKTIKEDKVACMAFIEFAEASSAAKVISGETVKVAGKEVKVAYAFLNRRRFSSRNRRIPRNFMLRVSGFPDDVSVPDVAKNFKGGEVAYASAEKGFVLINFKNEDEMKKAKEDAEKQTVGGKKLSIEVEKDKFRKNGRYPKGK